MRIPCLRQDLKQLIIREEVKPRECCTFDLKVILHLLLDLLQLFVVLLELSQQLLRGAAIVHQRSLEGLHHDVLPELIDYHEFLVLFGELLLDIFCTEDVFEVHPLTLTGKPLVDYFRD